jgi:HD-like signal output (HDOD) protein
MGSVLEQHSDSVGLLEDMVALGAALPIGNHAALVRVAELCAAPNWTPEGIALEISRDERLAAELLRIANSAFSASRVDVTDVKTAVVRLGPRMVRGLALAAPGARLLAQSGDALDDVRRAVHRHAVRTAVVAWAIAPDEIEPDTALTAGLLHNLGLNLLTYSAPGETRMIIDSLGEGDRLVDGEERLLGFSHGLLGAALAERWTFPPLLVDAIRLHTASHPEHQLASLVRLADLLVREAGIGIEPPEPIGEDVFLAAKVWVDPRDRIRPLLEAQDRLDAAMEREVAAGVELVRILDGSV